MIVKKKICMVGYYAVGKTSLVRRFVDSIFSEKYLTTVGVQIDKKTIMLEDTQLDLVLWDIAGKDGVQTLEMMYMRGASGYVLVADGTRRMTLDQALLIREKIEKAIGRKPFVLVINKADLVQEWDISEQAIDDLATSGLQAVRTSAKTGEGVEEVFLTLAKRVLEE